MHGRCIFYETFGILHALSSCMFLCLYLGPNLFGFGAKFILDGIDINIPFVLVNFRAVIKINTVVKR